jgi:DNA-binding transcriptional MerR regulator
MWISELSRRTGVPVATIKYYLREGLLPPGEAVGATRARYDETHVRRLRLIRALVQAGGLSLSRVRAVLSAVDEESRDMHEVLGAAHGALVAEAPAASPQSKERVDRLLADLGWLVHEGSADRTLLAGALDALEDVGYRLDDKMLQAYAEAAQQIGDTEVAHLPAKDRAGAVEAVVVVTALGGPVLLALRRLAQENASAHRYGIGCER